MPPFKRSPLHKHIMKSHSVTKANHVHTNYHNAANTLKTTDCYHTCVLVTFSTSRDKTVKLTLS
jgi:hypothetical protein